MFRNIFGDLNVKVPDEEPGTRWKRLRRMAMISKKDTDVATETINRLEAASKEALKRVSFQSVMRYTNVLAEKLKCSPLDILLYVYPELKNPAVKRQRGDKEESI